jgi:hypothetical protein
MIALFQWLSPRLNHPLHDQRKIMSARTTHCLVAAAIAALILGAILSRVIEPGVRVEKIMLTTNTPALRIFPATAGPHPIALLAHGNGASKEMLFRFGEALAAAGFDCYSGRRRGPPAPSPQRRRGPPTPSPQDHPRTHRLAPIRLKAYGAIRPKASA